MESAKGGLTKAKLTQAFMELCAEKRIEKISIKEITDKAGFHRGTFYIYYKDIYDLLEQEEATILSEVSSFAQVIIPAVIRKEKIMEAYPWGQFFQKNALVLKILMGPNGDPNFLIKLRALVKDVFVKTFGDFIKWNRKTDYLFAYISSAQLGLLTYWIRSDMDIPIEELADMIQTFMWEGPLKLAQSLNAIS